MHIRTKITALVLAALTVLALAGPAAAAPKPRIDLRGESLASYFLDEIGNAHLSGVVIGKPFDGGYTATLSTDDGTLPEPGECEPATAALRVAGARGKYFTLEATGDVCGKWTDATYVVTHSFTGRYDVVDTNVGRVRRTDGWIGVILATEDRANVELFDS
jgi:hypothetical protein